MADVLAAVEEGHVYGVVKILCYRFLFFLQFDKMPL